MLVIRLLGGVSIERDGSAVTGPFTQRHRVALLAMLAAAHPHGLARERLAAYLWPERSGESSRNLLNQGVHALRKGLGEGTIVSAGDELRFEPGSVRCDVIDFGSALEEADPGRAVGVYSGPFLEGFVLPDAVEFEHWVDQERERLRRACCGALETLAVEAEEDPAEAVTWWRQLAALAPYSGRVAIGLMEALEASGDRAAALAHAQVHAQLLEEEFDAEPNPDVMALAERLRTAPVARLEPPEGRERAGSLGESRPPDAEPDLIGDGQGNRGSLLSVPPADAAAGRDRSALRRLGLAALAGAAAITLVAVLWPLEESSLDPERVLVVPFENRTGDVASEELGFMAADWITQDLLSSGTVKVIPTETALRAARYAQERPETDARADPLGLMAEEAGAGMVITGAYYQVGDSLRFQARITDARRGEVLRSLQPAATPSSDPMRAIEQLRQRTVAALASLLDTRLEAEARMDRRPPSREAFAAYKQGVEHFISGRLWDAKQAHERATALDSSYTFMAPRISLAFTLFNLGQRAEAYSLVDELVQHRDGMGPYDRALVDQLRSWTAPDRGARYEAARRVAELVPGSLPHVQWAAEALWLNRPREAIRVLTEIDPTRGVVRGLAPYWGVLTTAYHVLGDHRRELREARRARSLYPDDPRLVSPEALALAALGRLEELERVIGSLPMSHDPRPASNWGMLVGYVADDLAAHGHEAEARRYYDRSLEWYEARVEEGQVEYRRMVAVLLAITGENQQSLALLRQLVGENPDTIPYVGMLGVVAARLGDRQEAERISRWLHEQPPSSARARYLAFIAAGLGDRPRATQWLKEAFDLGLMHGFEPHVHPFLDPLRGYPPFEELLRPKG